MSSTGAKYSLKKTIWAKQIRIAPDLKTPLCLAVRLYGCLWSKGLVSYTMPPNDIYEKTYYEGELENDGFNNGNDIILYMNSIKKQKLKVPVDLVLKW